jgi:hypothetical protein
VEPRYAVVERAQFRRVALDGERLDALARRGADIVVQDLAELLEAE